MARADEIATGAAVVVGRADEIATGAAVVMGRADEVAGTAEGVVARADRVADDATALLTAYTPVLEELRPILARLAETFDPREVEAMVALVDRLPGLLDSVDTDVMPLLRRLDDIAPDLHALLAAVDDLRSAVAGLPGIGHLLRRGDDEVADPDPRPGATRA
jgi:hypothetical protein